MRIGLFTDQYYPNISGVVTSIKMLYDGLKSMGHSVYIFTSFDEKKAEGCPELRNNDIVNLPGKPYPFKDLKDYQYHRHKRRLIKMIQPYDLDIIHVHTEFGIAKIARVVSKKLNIPIVHTLHTLYEDYLRYVSPFFDKHFHKVMFKTLAKMFVGSISEASVMEIVPTKKVYNMAAQYYMKNDIRIIPTGIELGRFDSSLYSEERKQDLKRRLGISEDAFVYAYIGRTSSEKSIDTIIRAFARMKNKDNCVLLIVGGGPQLEHLKKEAEEMKIQNQTIFTGFIELHEIPIFYQIADIFVNASKSETQGLTYVEALASSLPVLVQRDLCIEDVVEDYYNGIYFDGEEELVTKMEEIRKAPSTLKNIKSNTAKSVEKFSKENYCKNIERLYQEAIKKFNNKVE